VTVNKQVSAFAPGNVSCVFQIVPSDEPLKMHSLGVCFTVTEGINVSIFPDSASGDFEIVLNGEIVQFRPVLSVLEALLGKEHSGVRVIIETALPLGCGFGVSGASCLATALAVNKLFGLKKNRHDLGMVAHCAEVAHLTGLGDVCGQYHGGCILRLTKHQPLAAQRLSIAPSQVYVRIFGPLATDEVLKDESTRRAINQAGNLALTELSRFSDASEITLYELISLSREFAEQSTLIRHAQVREMLVNIDRRGGVGSMIMLGNGVFANIPFQGAVSMQIGERGAEVLGAALEVQE